MVNIRFLVPNSFFMNIFIEFELNKDRLKMIIQSSFGALRGLVQPVGLSKGTSGSVAKSNSSVVALYYRLIHEQPTV